MIDFNISPLDESLLLALRAKIDDLTKPKGSLGLLEEIAAQIGAIQGSLSPQLHNPHHIVFAADHGVVDQGVSLSPKEVTQQMVLNFQQGGAGCNFLARQHNISMDVVDVGVDYDFTPDEAPMLIKRKVRRSTRNYLYEAAMTHQEAMQAMQVGVDEVNRCHAKGCNVISFGEMGITNTSSSSLWISMLMGSSLKECVGAGCDHSGGIVAHKYSVLKRALDNYSGSGEPFDVMCYFGGYEMVATVGAMLRAAELRMVVLVDGFIMTACVMMASRFNPQLLSYMVYGHQGDETAHKAALDFLGAKPILHLGLRLGEGTGALCAYPIVDSAVRMINEMNSFGSFEVAKYFD
ncbi:MAG: nicotinate-nucleotide--dimethylbenzimidazole phosphoribosyltransferase [Rikenellaceae bacterium]